MQAQLKWTDGMQFVARAGNGPALVMDSREAGSGASPMELVLMGVAGCTAMDVVSIMTKKRARLSGVTINITGNRAEEHPKRFTGIHIEYVIEGRDIRPGAVEQAVRLSETKYCSAIASLNADFSSAIRIVESEF
ncbi:MAG: OsmC family peroxiredoxin [Desulfobacteraceae bacterium]|nr:MAG: OsmC family peroxiredoxin [Desulfobacteraceae bacterium]